MPYEIRKGGGSCSGSEWAVVKKGTDSSVGCHKTEASAKKQLAALYINVVSKESAVTTAVQETTPLGEKSTISSSGKMVVQAISAGVGSTGYYSPEILQEAAGNRLIRRGTPLHMDHPSASEHSDRPERSVQTIAGVFTGDATYDRERQALVGEVQVFSHWRERVKEMSPYIGLSIQGAATDIVPGVFEGKKVPVVEGLAAINSVDFVTRAGRGGQVLAILEAAKDTADPTDAVMSDVMAAYGAALTEAGLILETAPIPPVIPSGTTKESKEDTMPQIQIEEATHLDLVARAGRVAVLESERDTAVQERDTIAQERDTAVTERDQARSALAESARAGSVSRILSEASQAAAIDLDLFQSEGISSRAVNAQDGSLDEAATRTAFDTALATIKESAGHGRPRGLGTVRPLGESHDPIKESDFAELDQLAFVGTGDGANYSQEG